MPLRTSVSALILVSTALLVLGPTAALSSEPIPDRPNIVVIVADDLGWGDVGYHGSEIETPSIDALAAEGAELDRFYANPACSPTRASLLTGQTSMRLGVLRPLTKNSPTGLPLDRKLLPEYLRDAGYQTALAGKWHLGFLKRAQNPNQRGFDSFYGNVSGGVGYWDHVNGGSYDWQRDGVTKREEGYTTHLITREAERVIAERDPDRPLFLYVAYNAPHLPNEAPEEALARYAHIENPNRRTHAAMVSEMDRGIGRIVEAIERAGMAENTVVWFFSDNGGLNPSVMPEGYARALAFVRRFFDDPLPTRALRFFAMNVEQGAGDNGPFRKGKESVYEGGVRVAASVSWPGHIRQGKVEGRVTVVDVLPTLLDVANVQRDDGQVVDGRSRLSTIAGRSTRDRAPDFITTAADGEAIYRDQWKLIALESGGTELYDLNRDPTEQNDVADEHPGRVAEFSRALADFSRGENMSAFGLNLLWDPDGFGGDEYGPPMAERVLD